ncbi:MAG: hypothetical protein QMD44_09395 [Thermodesulfovibrionales bacterium]|jgi:hypothetical protein|nr:hypothetical protein [Thermodesulfovibrionales bacterium]
MAKIGLLSKLGIIILAFGLTALYCNYAYGAEWELYAENQNFSFYYNVEAQDPLKNIFDIFRKKIVTVWTKRVSKDDKGRNWQIQENKRLGLSIKGYENYEYTVFLREINCSDRISRSISEADYTKNGNLLSKSESPYSEWKPIVPGSYDEALQKTVCAVKTSGTQETKN